MSRMTMTSVYHVPVILPEASRTRTLAVDVPEETEHEHVYYVLVEAIREAKEQAEVRGGQGDEDGLCLLNRVAAAWESILECLQRFVRVFTDL